MLKMFFISLAMRPQFQSSEKSILVFASRLDPGSHQTVHYWPDVRDVRGTGSVVCNNVMILNWILHHWPFVRGNHRWPVDPPRKPLVILSIGIFFVVKQAAEQTITLQVIWDAVTLIWQYSSVCAVFAFFHTVKPVRNYHLYSKIYCQWFIQ